MAAACERIFASLAEDLGYTMKVPKEEFVNLTVDRSHFSAHTEISGFCQL